MKVCEEHPEIVSYSIVIECIDKQNADHALQMFSEKVEEQLTKNGHTSEALFVHLVDLCNWHRACGERGMAADDLWLFRTYLVKDVDFNRFPAPSAYVKGIPILTYSALLQNISVQLLLYKLCKYGTYNARYISSLVCESFFSMVTAKELYDNGCPKAADVPKIMSHIITIETSKNRSDLNFHIQTVKKPLYPVQRETGQYLSDDTISSSYYPNHPFDIQHKKRKARNFKDVTGENSPFRGGRSVCSKGFKVDEEYISAQN